MGFDEWIERSVGFARAAVELRRAGLHNLACFAAHQAVELALKALIIMRTGAHPFTHSLTELLDVVSRLGFGVGEELYLDAEWLEPHYVLARYPARGVKPYNEGTSARCVAAMERLLRAVEEWSGRSFVRG